MKKNKFVKSTIILIIGGLFTKILGMAIKIVITRIIGTEGIGIYSLIVPTFMLLNTIAQFGLPTSLNILVAKNNISSKKLVSTACIISLLIDIIIFIFLFTFGKTIAINLLKESRCTLGILSIAFILPFISISNMLRSYFFGKQRMYPHVITNVLEDIVRLLIIILFLPYFLKLGIMYATAFIILTNIASELTSIIIFIILLPNFKISKKELKPDKKSLKELLNICIPTTGSRLIGSIGYFLEPIILTYVLLKAGYTNKYIINEYGIINGYVMPLILLPSFFTSALSNALIPIVSNNYEKHNYKYIKRKIKQAIFYSLLIGIPATIIFLGFPEIPLKYIYNTNQGINYIKFLAPICLLHYIQSPISSSLQAMGKAKISLKGTLYGVIIRTTLLFILCHLKIGIWGLILATTSNIIFVTLYDLYNVKKVLKNKNEIVLIN